MNQNLINSRIITKISKGVYLKIYYISIANNHRELIIVSSDCFRQFSNVMLSVKTDIPFVA